MLFIFAVVMERIDLYKYFRDYFIPLLILEETERDINLPRV